VRACVCVCTVQLIGICTEIFILCLLHNYKHISK
jgi:hypothetical protein